MNLLQAQGPGSPSTLASLDPDTNIGAAMVGDITMDHDNKDLIHGILMAIVAIILAPFDILVAGALRKWPILHMLTSSSVLIFFASGFGLGVVISGQYLSVSLFKAGTTVVSVC